MYQYFILNSVILLIQLDIFYIVRRTFVALLMLMMSSGLLALVIGLISLCILVISIFMFGILMISLLVMIVILFEFSMSDGLAICAITNGILIDSVPGYHSVSIFMLLALNRQFQDFHP